MTSLYLSGSRSEARCRNRTAPDRKVLPPLCESFRPCTVLRRRRLAKSVSESSILRGVPQCHSKPSQLSLSLSLSTSLPPSQSVTTFWWLLKGNQSSTVPRNFPGSTPRSRCQSFSAFFRYIFCYTTIKFLCALSESHKRPASPIRKFAKSCDLFRVSMTGCLIVASLSNAARWRTN